MEFVDLKGDGFEIGRRHGELLAGDITSLLTRFNIPGGERWLRSGWSSRELAAERTGLIKRVERCRPEAISEMQGIAEGSGIDFEDILLWNFVSDIGYLRKRQTGPNTTCSVIIIPKGQAGPLFGQNTDLPVHEGNPLVIKRIHPDAGKRVIGVGWAGTAWFDVFLNEDGLVRGGVSGGSALHPPAEGIPSRMLGPILASGFGEVKEVAKFLSQTAIVGKNCINLGFVDRQGNAAIVEKAGVKYQYEWLSRDEPLYATTNFRSEKMRALSVPRPDAPAGEARYRSIAANLKNWAHTVAGLMDILRAHGPFGPVCCHDGNEPSAWRTVASFVMVPRDRKMLAADGPPCENQYEEYGL